MQFLVKGNVVFTFIGLKNRTHQLCFYQLKSLKVCTKECIVVVKVLYHKLIFGVLKRGSYGVMNEVSLQTSGSSAVLASLRTPNRQHHHGGRCSNITSWYMKETLLNKQQEACYLEFCYFWSHVAICYISASIIDRYGRETLRFSAGMFLHL